MIGSGDLLSDRARLDCSRRPGDKWGDCKPVAHSSDIRHSALSPLARCMLLLLVLVAGAFGFTGCAKKEAREAEVVVPNVLKQNLDQARETLATVRLKPGNISGASGAIPPGAYVVSQSPVAGQQVAVNSAVDLVVEVPVTVPSLTGTTVTDAVSILQGLGLKVAFVNRSTVNPFGKPKVEQQNPAANTSVDPNTVVTLTVSTPPDVGGLIALAQKEPAYRNLKPEYKNILDAFLGNPSTPRSMAPSPDAPTQ
jgi:beta-lactam-binding protein with PASTA domain